MGTKMSDTSRRDGIRSRVCRLIAGSSPVRVVVGMGVCLAVLGGAVVACSDDGDGTDSGAGESSAGSWVEHAAEQQGDGSGLFAGYTEDEIGTEILVDEKLASRHILARYRTYDDYHEASAAEDNWGSLSPEGRDRVFFEQMVSLLFLGADDAMPAQVKAASDELWHAFYESLDLCVERSEWPEAKLYETAPEGYYPASWEAVQSYQRQYGMTLDEYIDFKHECHKFAVLYPALDRDHRDELLRILRDYYLDVLRLWMRDNPEMVVPMTYEQSVNHPYQDYVRETCRASDDPQECALSEGITLE